MPGPFVTTAVERVIIFPASGKVINAGILASYFVRNPEDTFPGLAERLIWGILNTREA